MIFAMAGVEYEDVRFEHDEWLEKHKPNAPFGQCPFIEIIKDGKSEFVCQSHAMVGNMLLIFLIN